MGTAPIRVIVVEPMPIARHGMSRLIGRDRTLVLVGTFADVSTAVASRRLEAADVAIVGGDSSDAIADATHQLRVASEDVQVVGLVPSADSPALGRVLAAGAVTAVTFDVDQAAVTNAVELAAEGRSLHHDRHPASASHPDQSVLDELSPRQAEVLALVGAGLPRKAIAHRLQIGESTVKTHLSSIFQRLGVSGRREAAIVAQRAQMDHPRASASGWRRSSAT